MTKPIRKNAGPTAAPDRVGENRGPIVLEPKTIVMVAATALTTALTLSPWIPLAGAVGVGMLIWFNLRARSEEESRLIGEAKYALEEPDLPPGIEPEYRSLIQSSQEAERRLLGEIRDSNELVRRIMESSLPSIRELGKKHLTLALKLREINSYLQSVNLPLLEKDIQTLSARIASTSDTVTSQGLRQALSAKEERLKVYGDLGLGVERLRAHLESIQAALEKFHGQVVKMKSAEARQVSIESENVSQTVNSLNLDVDALTDGIEKVFNRSDSRLTEGGMTT